MNANELPPLPMGDDVMSRAVRSVAWRGFHDVSGFQLVNNSLLMAQYGRLVEEADEYEDGFDIHEAADVIIVCAQMLWLLDGHRPGKRYVPYRKILKHVALIFRYIRKDKPAAVVDALWDLVATIRLRYPTESINAAIDAKLEADEARGYQHNGDTIRDLG